MKHDIDNNIREKYPQNIDIIIVDETSMVDIFMFKIFSEIDLNLKKSLFIKQ